MKKLKAALCLLLAAGLLSTEALAYGPQFADVGYDNPCRRQIEDCLDMGLIQPDENGNFRPEDNLLRGELFSMLSACGNFSHEQELPGEHWAEEAWAELEELGVLEELSMDGSPESLETPVNRYDVASVLYNFIHAMPAVEEVDLTGAERYILDYRDIPEDRREAVSEVYAMGILTGADGTEEGLFCGDYNMTRTDAALMLLRLVDKDRRQEVDLSHPPEPTATPGPRPTAAPTPGPTRVPAVTAAPTSVPAPTAVPTATPGPGGGQVNATATPGPRPTAAPTPGPTRVPAVTAAPATAAPQAAAPNGSVPFASWAQSNGLLNGWGGTPEFNQLFFGSSDKSCFTSWEDAAPYMETVSVNVWQMAADGSKYASTMSLTVHKYLADDVYSIFQQIFNDPEQFPIYSVGGARFTDTMRHAWGAAIDINATHNCECNNRSGSPVITCGSGWWPLGTERGEFAGSLEEPSPYSIAPGGSVVRAFADHGWGWGGSWTGGGKDYMHFSIMASGG